MDEQGRLDVIDFVINVLREQERSMDDMVERLEALVHSLQRLIIENRAQEEVERNEKNESLTSRIRELERQVEMYRAQEAVGIDVLKDLYPIEQVEEVNANL